MAIQTIGSFALPESTATITISTVLVIDASGEKAAAVFYAPKAGAIRKVHFRLGVVTTGQTLRCSLQNLDASGNPDGTADQSGTVSVADADDNVWKVVTLGSDRTVAKGDMIAAVIEFDSTTGSLQISAANNVPNHNTYTALYTGSWAKQTRGVMMAIEYSDGSFAPIAGAQPFALTSVAFGSSSTPDEAGNQVTLPVTLRLKGVLWYGRATGDWDLVVYDSDGSTVLTTAVVDGDADTGTADTSFYAELPAAVTMTAGVAYRVVVKPSTATTLTRYDAVYPVSGAKAQDIAGAVFDKTSRTDAGAWTEDATSRVAMQLVFDGIDDGASAATTVMSRVRTGM